MNGLAKLKPGWAASLKHGTDHGSWRLPVKLVEQQRFDHDRHDVGYLDHTTDVHIIELLERDAVDRNHVSPGRDLVANKAAETHSNIAIDQEDYGQPRGQRLRQR